MYRMQLPLYLVHPRHAIPSPCCNLSIVTWLERTPANPSLPIQHLLCLSQTEMFSHCVFALLASRFWTATHSIKPHSYRLLIIEGLGFNEESFKNPVAPRFVGGVKVPQKCDNLPSFTCFTFLEHPCFIHLSTSPPSSTRQCRSLIFRARGRAVHSFVSQRAYSAETTLDNLTFSLFYFPWKFP